jgi:hypothetical protein
MNIRALPEFLLSGKTLKFLLGFSMIAFCASLWHRYAYIDDCWFGEQAYWLAKSGIVKTPSIQAGLGWEEQLLVYHKLNIWIGAFIVKLAGWSVYYFKIFILVVYLLFFYLLYLHQGRNNSRTYLLVALLVFANPLMFIYGFTYRPEILVMTCGFGSFVALEKIRSSSSRPLLLAAAGGAAAGLAFLSHLNGMIFPISGGIYLILSRKYKEIAVFGISFLLVAYWYFRDLVPAGNLELFLSQVKNWPDAVGGNYLGGESVISRIFLKLLHEHERFFWSDKVAVFSGIFLLSIVLSIRHLLKEHKLLLIYTGSLILFLNFLGSQIAERYLIYYLPFMALIIGHSILYHLHRKHYHIQIVFIILVIVQLVITGKHWASIMSKNNDFTRINHELSMMIPSGENKILAPYHFIFNEIGRGDILTYHTIEYFEVKEIRKLSCQEALERCRHMNIRYIIVDKCLEQDEAKYRWFEDAIRGTDLNYRKFMDHEGFLILERLNR